jgi:hypothetical protein
MCGENKDEKMIVKENSSCGYATKIIVFKKQSSINKHNSSYANDRQAEAYF